MQTAGSRAPASRPRHCMHSNNAQHEASSTFSSASARNLRATVGSRAPASLPQQSKCSARRQLEVCASRLALPMASNVSGCCMQGWCKHGTGAVQWGCPGAQDAHLAGGVCPHCSPAATMAALIKLCPASVSAALTLQCFRPTCERTLHAQQATPDAIDSAWRA